MAENNNKGLNKIAKEMIDDNLIKQVDETSQQLAEKMDKEEVKNEVAKVASGAPKGSYNTLAELRAALPQGDEGNFVVIKNDDGTNNGRIYNWDGSDWNDTGIVYQATGIPERSIGPIQTTFFTTGKNLYDKTKRTLNRILHFNGTIANSTGFDVSDYISITSGTTYTINRARHYCFFNTNKEFVTGVDNGATTQATFTAELDGFVRFTVNKSNAEIAQMEVGSEVTAYEEFQLKIPRLALADEQRDSMTASVVKEVSPTITESIFKEISSLKVYKTGTTYRVRSVFDDDNDIVIETMSNGSQNGTFNFERSYLIPKGSEDFGAIEVIHGSSSDDITPIRLSGTGTIGANHGYAIVVSITMSGHGKTNADLGSQWTDGTTTYTLLKIDGDKLYFGCPYTVTDGIVQSTRVVPTASLTHVRGATNTGDVSISKINSTSDWLIPSVNNVTVKYVLDGKPLEQDGVYYGNELQVQESYNIMDYKAIIDFAQNNIGVSYANEGIEGVIRMSINYTFTERGSVVINHGLRALKKAGLSSCGFIQSYPVEYSGHKTWRYMPNVLPKNGHDFKNIVDLSVYSTTTSFYPEDLIDPAIPPNRTIDWLRGSTTDEKKIGFALGYFPDKSNAKHADRLNNTAVFWDMRSTDKSYPIAFRYQNINAGTYLNFSGYRQYLSPNWKPNATDFYIIKDKKDTYVYIDYHQSVEFENIKLDEHIGKGITVLESSNFTLVNDMVDAEGVIFSISGGYGYAILKLT